MRISCATTEISSANSVSPAIAPGPRARHALRAAAAALARARRGARARARSRSAKTRGAPLAGRRRCRAAATTEQRDAEDAVLSESRQPQRKPADRARARSRAGSPRRRARRARAESRGAAATRARRPARAGRPAPLVRALAQRAGLGIEVIEAPRAAADAAPARPRARRRRARRCRRWCVSANAAAAKGACGRGRRRVAAGAGIRWAARRLTRPSTSAARAVRLELRRAAVGVSVRRSGRSAGARSPRRSRAGSCRTP